MIKCFQVVEKLHDLVIEIGENLYKHPSDYRCSSVILSAGGVSIISFYFPLMSTTIRVNQGCE